MASGKVVKSTQRSGSSWIGPSVGVPTDLKKYVNTIEATVRRIARDRAAVFSRQEGGGGIMCTLKGVLDTTGTAGRRVYPVIRFMDFDETAYWLGMSLEFARDGGQARLSTLSMVLFRGALAR